MMYRGHKVTSCNPWKELQLEQIIIRIFRKYETQNVGAAILGNERDLYRPREVSRREEADTVIE